ncbi:hypothetical protein ACH5A7_37920 [Streptomyces sp. NPDC018955]|uniref:hypothetical protein n=1 Tax=Streptomyces sp. NPDC018955 TaxID=3365055 RepID=UPI00378DEC05
MATPSVSPISLAARDHVRDVLGIFASNPLYCRVSGEFDPEAVVVEEVEAYLRKDLGTPGCLWSSLASIRERRWLFCQC